MHTRDQQAIRLALMKLDGVKKRIDLYVELLLDEPSITMDGALRALVRAMEVLEETECVDHTLERLG